MPRLPSTMKVQPRNILRSRILDDETLRVIGVKDMEVMRVKDLEVDQEENKNDVVVEEHVSNNPC